MAEEKKLTPDPKYPEPKTPEVKSAPRSNLAPAGESGDPAVQKLLADRQAHVSNAGLDPDPEQDAVRKDALAAIDEIDEELAKLGYTAK